MMTSAQNMHRISCMRRSLLSSSCAAHTAYGCACFGAPSTVPEIFLIDWLRHKYLRCQADSEHVVLRPEGPQEELQAKFVDSSVHLLQNLLRFHFRRLTVNLWKITVGQKMYISRLKIFWLTCNPLL